MNAHVLAALNHKGGVGKTMTCLNLVSAYADQGLVHRLHQKLAVLKSNDDATNPVQIHHRVEQFCDEIAHLKQEWDKPLNKAVNQSSMEQGDIEMF